MGADIAMTLGCTAGLVAGLAICCALYAHELKRTAAFLRGHDLRSNERATIGAGLPGMRSLANAANTQLDAMSAAHTESIRRQSEFQRDLSALSHDIRTPLMGARGYLQLASHEADEARRSEHLEAASRRIDDVDTLLDQLFAYTKASDPDLTLDFERIEVRPVIEGVLLAHFPEFEARGWEPRLSFESNALFVEADLDALSRVVENLVANALRHGTDALRVSERVEGMTGTPDERIHVIAFANEVADASTIETDRLFERFYRADPARRRGGSGLGLSVASRLATSMGMSLSAHVTRSELVIELRVREA